MKKVILMCGTGASSSFMASKTRKALLSRNANIEITARSDSELEDVMKTADLILIGPHLKFIKEEIINTIKESNLSIPVDVISQKIYGSLNGEALADYIIDVFKKEDTL